MKILYITRQENSLEQINGNVVELTYFRMHIRKLRRMSPSTRNCNYAFLMDGGTSHYVRRPVHCDNAIRFVPYKRLNMFYSA